uniref:Calaxin n=1 Tax=Sus scrofa TaxID=9823 RepID=A0A8D0UXI4_PIG
MNSVCLGKDTALTLGRSQQLSVALMGVNLTMDACRRPGAAVCKLTCAELKLGIKDGLNACCYICIFSFTVNKFEVKCLISLFYNLVGDVTERQGVVVGLDRNTFRNILHVTFGMTDDMIMDRVFRGFDKDNDGCVSVSEWVYGLSVFLRGTLEEKMKYCFEVFDLNGDGFISKEEMVHMLKNSLLKQPSEEDPDEGIKDLVEITLKKMDHDHDGKLSFPDYEAAVREEALLLEAFGPCLPDPKSQKEFEAQVFKDPNEFGEV